MVAGTDQPGVGRMSDTEEVQLSDSEKQKLLKRILDNFVVGTGADEMNRRNHTADLMFAYGADQMAQWDPSVLQLRQGRPSYTCNRVLQPINNLCGEQRQTRPSVKVRPASENASTATATIFEGLWRSIEIESRAEAVYDESFKQAVAGGYGEIMIFPQYESDQSFNQVLRIINIPNPETVTRAPESTDPCGADAEWAMVGTRISKEKYAELFPDFDPTSFPMSRDSFNWRTDGMVRVVDYFERVAKKTTIAELDDGRVIEFDADQRKVEEHLERRGIETGRVKRKRTVKKHKIRWVKTDGANILDGPVDYEWQRIPIARMPGRYINVEGRQVVQSLIRHSWDPQRAYNFQFSDAIERSALVPKARYILTSKQILGLEGVWNSANNTPRMWLPYNVDKDAPGPPHREDPIDVPAGAAALAEQAAQDIQATIGIFNPSLGNNNDMDRMSGRALVSHTQRGDLGTHEFIDNYGKCVQLLCEMGMDMIPTVYDSKRIVRIVNGDGKESVVPINNGDVNNLKEGRYDCVVTLGPAYQTQRQESLATMMEAVQQIPLFGQVAPDLIAGLIDLPQTEEFVKRMRSVLIKQGVVQPTPEEAKNMPPPQPNPMQQAQLQQEQAKAQREQASAAIEASKAHAGGLELHKMINETAGRHLDNLMVAKQLGQPAEAQAAESQAASAVR